MSDTPSLLALLHRGSAESLPGDRHDLGQYLRPEVMPDLTEPWRLGVIEALLPAATTAPGQVELVAASAHELRALAKDWYHITLLTDPEHEQIHGEGTISCPYTLRRIAEIEQDLGFPVLVSIHILPYGELHPDHTRSRVSTDRYDAARGRPDPDRDRGAVLLPGRQAP